MEANCWVKGKGGISESKGTQEDKGTRARKESRQWSRRKGKHVGLGELIVWPSPWTEAKGNGAGYSLSH